MTRWNLLIIVLTLLSAVSIRARAALVPEPPAEEVTGADRRPAVLGPATDQPMEYGEARSGADGVALDRLDQSAAAPEGDSDAVGTPDAPSGSDEDAEPVQR